MFRISFVLRAVLGWVCVKRTNQRKIFLILFFLVILFVANPFSLVSNTLAYLLLSALPGGSARTVMATSIAESGSTMFMGFALRSNSDRTIRTMITLGVPRYERIYGYTSELAEAMSYALLDNVKNGRYVDSRMLFNLNEAACPFWGLYHGVYILNDRSIEYLTIAYKQYMTDHQKRLARNNLGCQLKEIAYFLNELEKYKDSDAEYWKAQAVAHQALMERYRHEREEEAKRREESVNRLKNEAARNN